MTAMAQALASARRQHRVLPAPAPSAALPATLADAYRLQDAFMAEWRAPVAGWKAGATAAPVQARFGVTGPFAGPVYADDVLASPAAPASARFAHHCLECEFAFRIATRLAPRAQPFTRAEVEAAVGALVPAIEIISPRFDRLPFEAPLLAIADCGLNGGLVTGRAIADWRGIDLAGHRVRLLVDGVPRAEGTGANVLGDPVLSLVWTANHVRERGRALEAGALVSTGTMTGLTYVAPGARAVADFGALGTVEVTFGGPPHPALVAPAG
jgi:2-keto-4-pentenoate hydratase